MSQRFRDSHRKPAKISGYVDTHEPETSNSNYKEAVGALKVPVKSESPPAQKIQMLIGCYQEVSAGALSEAYFNSGHFGKISYVQRGKMGESFKCTILPLTTVTACRKYLNNWIAK